MSLIPSEAIPNWAWYGPAYFNGFPKLVELYVQKFPINHGNLRWTKVAKCEVEFFPKLELSVDLRAH